MPRLRLITATEPPSRVSLVQHIGDDTAQARWLRVEPNGEWSCEDCAGDGKNGQGKLSPAEIARVVHA